jgi:hypothetical protein
LLVYLSASAPGIRELAEDTVQKVRVRCAYCLQEKDVGRDVLYAVFFREDYARYSLTVGVVHYRVILLGQVPDSGRTLLLHPEDFHIGHSSERCANGPADAITGRPGAARGGASGQRIKGARIPELLRESCHASPPRSGAGGVCFEGLELATMIYRAINAATR